MYRLPQLREAVADAITHHPGNRTGTPEQRHPVSLMLADTVLRVVRPCTCDGDPIECSHEAARGQAEAELEQLRAEVVRLRAGEADNAGEPYVQRTPAQWLRRFNDMTPEQRLAMATAFFNTLEDSASCFQMDHEGRLEDLARLEAMSLRVRAERDRLAGSDTIGVVRRHVIDRLTAALDGGM